MITALQAEQLAEAERTARTQAALTELAPVKLIFPLSSTV